MQRRACRWWGRWCSRWSQPLKWWLFCFGFSVLILLILFLSIFSIKRCYLNQLWIYYVWEIYSSVRVCPRFSFSFCFTSSFMPISLISLRSNRATVSHETNIHIKTKDYKTDEMSALRTGFGYIVTLNMLQNNTLFLLSHLCK